MNNYIVIEIQTDAGGAVAALTTVCDSYETAQQKYHTVLAAAAVSDLPMHSAAILSPLGERVDSQCFNRIIDNAGNGQQEVNEA